MLERIWTGILTSVRSRVVPERVTVRDRSEFRLVLTRTPDASAACGIESAIVSLTSPDIRTEPPPVCARATHVRQSVNVRKRLNRRWEGAAIVFLFSPV